MMQHGPVTFHFIENLGHKHKNDTFNKIHVLKVYVTFIQEKTSELISLCISMLKKKRVSKCPSAHMSNSSV